MSSSVPVTSPKSKTAQEAADYSRSLRTRRKEQGFVLVHWYVHGSAYDAIVKAAQRESRNVQQFVSLNIWQMVPEDLRPKNIFEEPIVIPKKKRVVLSLKIRPTQGNHASKQS